MVSYLRGAALAAALLFQTAVGLESATSEAYAAEMHAKTLAEMTSRMTLKEAVKVLQASNHSDAKTLSLIKGSLNNQHHKIRGVKKGHSKAGFTPTDEATKDYSGGVWDALYKINDMLLETIEKWDLEEIRCKSFERTSWHLQEEIKEDLAAFIILRSEAIADAAAASAKVTEHEEEGEKTNQALKDFEKEMSTELTEYRRQLGIATADLGVAEKILNLTECAESTGSTLMQTHAQLMDCVDTKTGRHFEKVKLTSKELKTEFAKMKHPKILQMLRAAGIDVGNGAHQGVALTQNLECGCSCYNGTLDVLFGAQQNNNTCNILDSQRFNFLDNCCVRGTSVQPCCAVPTIAPEFSYGDNTVNTSADYMGAQDSRCSLKESSFCPELRERFLNINGQIHDTIEQLNGLIMNTEKRKEDGEAVLNKEIAYHSSVAISQDEKLDRAVAARKAVEEDQRQKGALLTKTEEEYDAEVKELYKYLNKELPLAEPYGKCPTVMMELDNERCALIKIRGELLNMDTLPNNVTDCALTEWKEGECSTTCGGGTRTLTRTVEMEPFHGYQCPALQAQTSCFEPRCPLDCILADWTNWSPCSAMCNGGVEDRIRPVVQHDTKGGEPCGQTDDETDCNVQACSGDCVLEDWTAWSPTCSKMCGGGRQSRYRHIKHAAFGEDGTCAQFHDASRFQWKQCNTQPCNWDPNKDVLCESPLDVIVALDGSGSVGDTGWAAIQLAAEYFITSMGSGTRVGAMVFSSPYDIKDADVCMGWKTPYPNWDPTETCGITWAHKLSDDKNAVKQAVKDATRPGYGTLTNLAIEASASEFISQRGRSFVQSVLVVFTDGHPESDDKTKTAANDFKSAGNQRILAVPVGTGFKDDEFFQDIVSYPYQDNIVNPVDFKELTYRSTLDKILQDFCPNILLQDVHHLAGEDGVDTLQSTGNR